MPYLNGGLIRWDESRPSARRSFSGLGLVRRSLGEVGCNNCSQCKQVACNNRNGGFGLGYYSIEDSTGGGTSGAFDSILDAAGSASKIAASFVPGGSLFSKLISGIGSLFGAAPRGNFAKFKRTAYPYMRTLAAQSGIPVIIGWFGETVAVNPDGSFGVIAQHSSDFQARLINSGYHPFYSATCDRSDDDCVNNPKDLGFVLNDPQNQVSSLADTILSIDPAKTTVSTLPNGTSTMLNTTSTAVSTMGIDLKSMLIWGSVFGAAYMLLTGRKGR